MSDLSSNIESNAQGPKQVVVDGVVVTQHSLPDQIAADQYCQRKAAANKSKLPIHFAKIRPGGAAP